jgi:phosphatidylserine/phosphatidylglycerophosphate/cardiolipin synthase-like enzyme
MDPSQELQVLASPDTLPPHDIPNTLSALLQIIQSAQSSVKIQVYEYSTKKYKSTEEWKVLDDAIRGAAGRGVHVQLLVDKNATKESAADLASLAKVENISVKTVTIPTWSGGVIPFARLIHSKYMIVDGKYGWVGSENWLGNYFTNNRNVGVLTTRAGLVSDLTKIFDHVWSSPYAESL